MVRRALLPLLNAFRFLQTYAQIDQWAPQDTPTTSPNIMDAWILSRLQTLKATIAEEMENYRLYNVVPALFEFIEELTNWYIRLNRGRFWDENMTADKGHAYNTLYTTLYELSLSMAPFTPFLAETIYQQMQAFGGRQAPESVHLCSYPEPQAELQQPMLEAAVTRMQHIILLGRQKRNQEKVKTKMPLAVLTVIHTDAALLEEISKLANYIQTELNVKRIDYAQNENDYIDLYAKPNSPVLGKRLGKQFRDYKQKIEALSSDAIDDLQQSGQVSIDDETFSVQDILVFREAKAGTDAISDRFISIDMKCELTPELICEGLAREIVSRVQKTRKDIDLHVADRIALKIHACDELTAAINEHRDYIMKDTLALELVLSDTPLPTVFEFDDLMLSLEITLAAT
jgi:isoleucyl-tRNA synthetase